jgi:hypothetical protein
MVITDEMSGIPKNTAAPGNDSAAAKPSKQVMLRILLEILSKYERGAAELSAEFDLPEITVELLMHVCLAAPEVDDLVLGFVRDDLKVVSLNDQTRQMVERDIGLLERDVSRWMRESGSALGRQLDVKNKAEADARLAQGQSSELEAFILKNDEVYGRIRALKHSDLVRWVMLSLMRETNARERGSAVIAAWMEKLEPELRARVQTIQKRYGANSQKKAVSPAAAAKKPGFGSGVGGP